MQRLNVISEWATAIADGVTLSKWRKGDQLMEANAVKVRFFRKEYGRISRGLSDHKFLYFLPSNVKDRHELHVGSVIAVNNHYGVVEAAVIVEFLYSNHVDDFKQVLGNYHADYYGEMEDGDEQ